MITSRDQSLIDNQSTFIRDLQYGFSKKHKKIPSKYFYDKKGSDIFNAITHHDDYYLTQCEIEILRNQIKLSKLINDASFNLIELGPGEGIKSKIIINELLASNSSFTYIPIDISKKYLDDLSNHFMHMFSRLQITPIEADWLSGLTKLNNKSLNPNIILFLGSSIGNYSPNARINFLKKISSNLQNNVYMLIGFDLCKEINILLRAYDDSSGLTREFNLNLLNRINRDLGGDFDVNQFEHLPYYNSLANAMESYLVSKVNQTVNIRSMNKTYNLHINEKIHVESSYKFTLHHIKHLAKMTGFQIIDNFFDSKNYFVCSLWKSKRR